MTAREAPPAPRPSRFRPVRVLMVHHNPDLYGASRSLLRLLGHLDRRRFSPTVVLPRDGPLRPLLEQAAVPVVLHPGVVVLTRGLGPTGLVILPWRFLASSLGLGRLIRAHRFDLVHTNTGVVPAPALAARLAGVPHVWHIRESFREFGGLWRPYRGYILATSRRVIAVSRSVASQFQASGRVVVVHNGLAPQELAAVDPAEGEQFRHRHGLDERPVVGCVGRIKLGRKGQETFVRAAAVLKRAGLRARYLIVGAPFSGNERHRDDLVSLIRDLDLEADVVLTGELDEVRPAYAAMSLLVVPSGEPEPFAGVVLEAMACGLPVVSTDVGGAPEQVVEGVTGLLVPPSDPEAMARAVARLLGDPELGARMGRAGAERVAESFSVLTTVARIEEAYEEALGET